MTAQICVQIFVVSGLVPPSMEFQNMKIISEIDFEPINIAQLHIC